MLDVVKVFELIAHNDIFTTFSMKKATFRENVKMRLTPYKSIL